MAFEARGPRGKTYLYLARRDRVTGTVEKLYVGRGPDAEAVAAVLEERRRRRAAERQAVERRGAELRPAGAVTAELDGAVATLFEAAMLAAGYHRANYSRWRKRRGLMTGEGDGRPPAGAERVDELADLRAVVAQAKAGDASVLPRLRAVLDGSPALVRHYGDLARQAEAAWVALAAGTDLYLRETLARAAEARRDELTRPGAQPVERLLVERVVGCWLQVTYLTASEANALAAGDTHRQLQHHARRVERAQRMHLTALGALATYQKLIPVPAAAVVPARADVGCAPPVAAELETPPPVCAPALADEAASQECDEREPVRLRIPC